MDDICSAAIMDKKLKLLCHMQASENGKYAQTNLKNSRYIVQENSSRYMAGIAIGLLGYNIRESRLRLDVEKAERRSMSNL